MVRAFFGRRLGIGGATRLGRDQKARPRRLQPGVDGLETRALMTGGGSVTLSGAAVVVLPDASASQNTVVVQNQNVPNVGNEIDVQLNGVDHDFAIGSISMVVFSGSGVGGTENFTNNTSVMTVACGGTGTNNFVGGNGIDEFVGGSGTNNFTAGGGYDILVGGTGTNIFTENAQGSGIIIRRGGSNTVLDPSGGGNYYII